MTNNETLGKLVSKLMDELEERYPNTSILEAGLVVILDEGERTRTHTTSTSALHYRNIGLFRSAVDCVESGEVPDD